MNFFAHQQAAKRQSKRLIWLFGFAVVGIVLAIDAVLFLAIGLNGGLSEPGSNANDSNIGIFLTASIVTTAFILIASMVRTAGLRQGGAAVAQSMGGTLITSDNTNPSYRRLRNVVEEIAIASGVPVPDIFVLEQEAGINAFAAGFAPADAAVAVTRGCLEKLTRDELQGVIAHEFSHVLNGDMRINIRLIGVLFGIVLLAQIGGKVLRHSRGGSNKNAGAILIVALGLLIVGSVGQFFARMIKASVSRQREYLADASAVQFTRQASGISGALKKIAALSEGSKLESQQTEEVSHMLFGDGVGYSSLFATHPPINSRIRRLQPGFNPRELIEIQKQWQAPIRSERIEPAAGVQVSIAGFAPAGLIFAAQAAPLPRELPASAQAFAIDARKVPQQVANPADDDYLVATSVLAEIPNELVELAHEDASAPLLLFALLLDSDQTTRESQCAIVETIEPGSNHKLLELWNALSALHPMQRLPLAALCFPQLRRHPQKYLEQFQSTINKLIHADGEVGLFEYCLSRLLRVQIADYLSPAAQRIGGKRKLVGLKKEAIALLVVLAMHGHRDEFKAHQAFLAGTQVLFGQEAFVYMPTAQWIAELDHALPELDQLDPIGKELLIHALVLAASEDGKITIAEAELLRTICAGLHCPLPARLN